jgi:hypothetical protein
VHFTTQGGFVRLAGAAVLSLLVACSTSGEGDGDAGTDGPDGAGQGDGGADLVASAIPDPPDDSCGQFAFQYAGPCTVDCPSVRCDCGAGKTKILLGAACFEDSQQRGCVVGVSCPALCTLGELRGIECVGARSCQIDGECGDGRCVVDPRMAAGECSRYSQRCREAADCVQGGACVAVAADGRRMCSGGAPPELCNLDSHCSSGRCAVPKGSFIGRCSRGVDGDPCFAPEDCAAGSGCVDPGEAGRALVKAESPVCSSGVVGAICAGDRDCRDGACAAARCRSRELGAVCLSGAHCGSGFCGLGLCTTGDVGARCGKDQACRSGHCAQVQGMGACTAGRDGDDCSLDAQCDSGHCAQPGNGISTGLCTRRGVGDRCFADRDCSDGFCHAAAPGAAGLCPTFPTTLIPCGDDGVCAYDVCTFARCQAFPPGSVDAGGPD